VCFRLAGYVRQLKRGADQPASEHPACWSRSFGERAHRRRPRAWGTWVMTYAANLAVELARDAGRGLGRAARPLKSRRWPAAIYCRPSRLPNTAWSEIYWRGIERA